MASDAAGTEAAGSADADAHAQPFQRWIDGELSMPELLVETLPSGASAMAAVVPIAASMVIITILSMVGKKKGGEIKDERSTKPGKRRKIGKNKFKSRQSRLDPGGTSLMLWEQDTTSDAWATTERAEFRGLFTLAQVIVFYFMATNMLSNYLEYGHILADRGEYVIDIVKGIPVFLASISGVYFWSFSAYVLQRLIVAGKVTGVMVHVLQHGIQVVLIGAACYLALHPVADAWPMSQRVALLLQTIILYMKMHSYIMTNRDLARAQAPDAKGGARARSGSGSSAEASPSGDADADDEDLSALPVAELKLRLMSLELPTSGKKADLLTRLRGGITQRSTPKARHVRRSTSVEPVPARARSYSSASAVADATAYTHGSETILEPVAYPNNVTLVNWMMFTVFPTLVYEPYYPRTTRFRLSYFLEKVSLAAALVMAATVLTSGYVFPVMKVLPDMDPRQSLASLLLPFACLWFIIFFLIFEVLLNAFAELTFFADRSFYDDWWNSTTFDEFARKWNKPVHEFLLRHIYLEVMREHEASRSVATVATFLFSMALHEMVLAVCFKMVQMWLFWFSLMQLPLIPLMRNPLFKGTRLGNTIFWWGMLTGIPLITVLYAREYCRTNQC